MQAQRFRSVLPVRAAVLIALYGGRNVAIAQAPPDDTLQEVIVTATSRTQDIEEVPYSISAISGDTLVATGVTDLVSLAREAPSFSLVDLGTRYESSEIPVVRGINASNIVQGPQVLAQSPVGLYIGNSPVAGYLELTDVQRVELLRGPQGTLYGAGALGGAVRIIPNAPELGMFSGSFGGNVGSVAHADDPSYGVEGFLNLPVGEALALRVSGKYDYQPGFIDAYGLVRQTGGPFSPPVLADPSEPATSPAVYEGVHRSWNFDETFTGRASLLWRLDNFKAELSVVDAHTQGDSGPQDDPEYAGGPYGVDPRITIPAGGDYKAFSAIDQPYTRDTTLTSLDLSYDAGFATLSSVSSYYDTHSRTFDNNTYGVFSFTPFETYYTGNPINPRFINPYAFTDADKAFSQELRVVSRPTDGDKLDYVFGAFYESQSRNSDFDSTAPGTDTYSIAEGCTAPYYSGASFPNCLVTLGPTNSTYFDEKAAQYFKDRSLYGELTWHLLKPVQITFGVRRYWQDFVATQDYISYPFGSRDIGNPNETSTSGNLFKVNPSFQYAKDQMIYATWSQGFRRGGSNSYILQGPLAESPTLLSYRPDKTDNFEVGFKGRLGSEFTYSLAAFDIEWKDPQINGLTPYTATSLVYNGKQARSTGVEAELSGSLVLPGLRYDISYAYADARLTKNFSLPANDGTGVITPGLISGQAGESLPGSPKSSAAATISYTRTVAPQYLMVATANLSYVGPVLNSLPAITNPQTPLPGYTLGNLSVGITHRPYEITGYVTNLANKRAVLGLQGYETPPIVGAIGDYNVINRPREIGVRMKYLFLAAPH